MKKIGNIICNNNLKVDNIFNKYNSINNIDNDLPTLVIGLENAKNNINGFNILKKNYNNGLLRWTFKKTERRSDYEEDMYNFNKICYENIIKDIKYKNIDIKKYSLNKIKTIIKYINNNNKKYCYLSYNENFLFLFDKKFKTVFGLSLSYCEYIGIEKNKILNKIFSNKNNVKIKNLSFFNENIKHIINDNPHYIPSFFEYFIGN